MDTDEVVRGMEIVELKKLLTKVVILCVLGVCMFGSGVASAATTRYEAESFAYDVCCSIANNASASGGQQLNITKAGTAYKWFTASADGTASVDLRVKAKVDLSGSPNLKVLLDDVLVKTINVSNTTYATKNVALSGISPGTRHKLSFQPGSLNSGNRAVYMDYMETKDPVQQETPPLAQSFISPAFWSSDHTDYWSTIDAVGQNNGGAGEFAIIGRNCSPCTDPDSQLISDMDAAHAAGYKNLYYVDTNYMDVPLADAKAEVDAAYQYYGAEVDGIYFDVCAPYDDPSVFAYYQDLYNYVRAKNGTSSQAPSGTWDASRHDYVVCNYYTSGVPVQEETMQYTDINLYFEGNETAYNAFTPPAWVANYDAGRFWNIVYGTPQADISSVANTGKSRNVGYMFIASNPQGDQAYVTPDSSSYLSDEQTALQATS